MAVISDSVLLVFCSIMVCTEVVKGLITVEPAGAVSTPLNAKPVSKSVPPKALMLPVATLAGST